MDMDVNVSTLDVSRLPSEVNGVTESDTRDMRGSSNSQENHPSFRDMLTKGTVTAQQDSIISALDVDLLFVVAESENVVEVLPQVTVTEPTPSPPVATMGQVVNVPSQLQPDKHVAVRVIEDGVYSDVPGHNAEWASHLSKSISTEGVHGSSSDCQIVESPVTSGHHEIQWIANSAYEGDLQFRNEQITGSTAQKTKRKSLLLFFSPCVVFCPVTNSSKCSKLFHISSHAVMP
ncbi:hypothetical protein V6N12_021057 [Hibiscus sabdariffa]|uniref:Uncharacterized protein n=1 Tax=Hibiscus sabdariffa TaxID=183260 RepID=A0ABR2B3F9_9ROSI